MTVRELLEKLDAVDPDAVVVVRVPDLEDHTEVHTLFTEKIIIGTVQTTVFIVTEAL